MARICKECGNEFPEEPRSDGQPCGVGFELEDGSTYYVCIDCFEKWLNEKKRLEIERDILK